MRFSKTCVNFERCYGNQGWAEAVEKYIFIFQFNSFKLSESFKSVAQGVPEIFEEVYLGGHNVPPPPGWDRVKEAMSSTTEFFLFQH